MASYHYCYYWLCVDMCNGGARRGDFRSRGEAYYYKPQNGLWELKRKRVQNQ